MKKSKSHKEINSIKTTLSYSKTQGASDNNVILISYGDETLF